MSKRQFKSQASSSRAAPTGGFGGFGGFGGSSSQSSLSYLTEPPNFSSISDPNVVVSFKNLSKKDRATKNRGLEDLRSYIQARPFEQDGGVEEAILEVWVQLYPRTAIDNDRNVRELSHEVQFELAKSARKRIEKYIPRIVGTWLAGTSDRDRGVSKMAQEGIKSLFNSEDKYRAFLKRCQSPILDYAIEAIKETPETLSDERNTSPDDMDAKYFRVLFSGIWQVLNLFSNLREEDISKCQNKYVEFLTSNEDLWGLVASKDALVRKSICELLVLCLKQQRETVEKNLPRTVQAFTEKGLRAGQSTTAKILLDTLKSLETAFPGIWTSKSLKYLRKFIEKGSQGGGSDYWTSLESVIKLIPSPLLPADLATSLDFFHSFRVGIKSSREGIRGAPSATWFSYIHIARLLGENLQDPNAQTIFYQDVVFPVFQNYLQPAADGTQDNSQWSISDPSIVAEAYNLFISLQEAEKDADAKNLFLDQWRQLVDSFIIRLRTSLPEQSKEYHKSQKDVAAESYRWFSLLQLVLSNSTTGSTGLAPSNPDLLVNASIQILNSGVELLVTRQGKPYSAADTLLEAIKGSLSVKSDLQGGKSPLVNWFRTAISLVKSFLEKNLATLVLSPSGPALISSLHILFLLPGQAEGCDEIWNFAVNNVLAASGSDDKFEIMARLIYNKAISPNCPSYLSDDDNSKAFTSHLVDLIHTHPALQLYLLEVAVKDLEHEALSKFRQIVSHDSLTKSSTTTLLERITKHLEHNKRSNHALKAFTVIFDKTPEVLVEESEMSSRYMTLFMIITDIPPGKSTPLWATTAQMLLFDVIKFVCSKSHEQPVEKSIVFKLIRENLRKHARNSLSPFVLFRCAMIFIQNAPPTSIDTVITSLFPAPDDWHKSLGPLFWNSPQDCLSMFNPLNGAASLAERDTAEVKRQSPASFLPFDTKGDPIDALNRSFRFAVYTANLLRQKEVMTQLPLALHIESLYHLLMFVEVAEDSLDGLSNGLQLYTCPWEEDTVEALMGPAGGCLDAFIDEGSLWNGGSGSEIPKLFDGLIHKCMELNNSTAAAFYASRVLCRLLNEHSKKYGWEASAGDKWLSSLRVGISNPSERKYSHGTFFTMLAILNGLGPHLAESPVIKTLFRQLVNQIADTKIEGTHLQDSLLSLVTLNACFAIYGWSGYDDVPELPFTNSRQPIFAVKQILSWTTSPHIEGTPVLAESCRVLRKLLPVISEVYGSYWDDTLSFCLRIWSTADGTAVTPENLSELYESVELVAKVAELSKGDNEDIHEAYTEHQEEISESLILLVQLPRDESLFLKRGPSRIFVGVPEIPTWSFNTPCRPLRKFDSILSKSIASLPLEHINDLEDLYPLIASESYLIQSAAFDLLSKALPEKQQQLSVDVILNKHDARLPDELLSLLLDAPTILKFNDEELAQYPSSIRTYLLSWQLVFTSYHQASEKVRNDYTLMLKSENCISPLLNFLSDALGHSAANALNIAKESIPPNLIRSYDWRVGEKKAPEADMQYLLVNIYYLALFYTPQLVREWFIDCQSKQTRIAIENWTEKFFSPLVIEDSMNEITDWAENQEEIDDEKKLIVKVSRKSREIFASYEVDETAIQIVIRLRESYPLDGVKVDGVNRVAVSEKKFQSWLINIQGLITFSNGYIPNGLAAFRKNVSGTLKGTEECAICYSIISADNKIPDKRCTTCSNLFHGSCLFKWFKSSNQSTCPLCRNPFNYGTKLPLR